MPIDFGKPAKTDNYDTGMLQSIRDHWAALARWLEPTDTGTVTSPPTNARRLNKSSGLFEVYDGAVWGEQTVAYAKKATTISAGAGLSGGGDLSASRTLSLAASGVGTGGTVGGNNSIPSITFDTYGRITGISGVTPSGTYAISVSGSSASCTGNATTATNATYGQYLWSTSHSGTYYVSAAWDGTYWQLTSNHGGGVRVAYADSAGSASSASTANALATGNNYQVNALGVGTSNSTTGTIYATGNITAYSDRRLKTDILPIVDALSKVCLLNGVTYKRVDDPDAPRQTGVIAQELQAVLPEAVVEHESDGTLMVAYGNVIGLLIEAIKELRAEVISLRAAR